MKGVELNMALDPAKCGQKTFHLRAKDTGKHYAKLLMCNNLECLTCQPMIAATLRKRIRYYAQHERLVFFNTITSKKGFSDLDAIWEDIRKWMFDFSPESYMRKKKCSREVAERWYYKKKKKIIDEDVKVETQRISRQEAIIEVAKQKGFYYVGSTAEARKKFCVVNAYNINKLYKSRYQSNLKNKNLQDRLRRQICARIEENEFEDFQFISVIEFHKDGEQDGEPHYHILTNRYLSHTLLKSVTTKDVSEIYDNTYIVEDALKKNPSLSADQVDTDIVAAYVSKITNYLSKETMETYQKMKNDGFKKKLVSSSHKIRLSHENKEEDDKKFDKIAVYDMAITAASLEIPDVHLAKEFITANSVAVSDADSVRLMSSVRSLDIAEDVKPNLIIRERLETIYDRLIEQPFVPFKHNFYDDVVLSDEQLLLLNTFKSLPVTMLVGRAGTGKSKTIASLVKYLAPVPEELLVVTYTGKASARLKELFASDNLPYVPTTIHKACSSNFSSVFKRNEKNILSVKYLIIDEISMIPRHILANLLLAIPSDCRILLAGDDAQLPPVNDVAPIAELRALNCVKTVELTKVFRSDDVVLNQAYAVLNKMPVAFEEFNDDNLATVVQDAMACGAQILTNTKVMTKKINAIVQADKTQITKCFNDFNYDVGDRVMIVANSTPRQVSNGDMGVIKHVKEDGVIVELDNGHRVFYKYEDTEEIVPAAAFTVHKSQGSEYEKVVLIFESQEQLNTNNLLYTGITRAKKDVKIYVRDVGTMMNMLMNVPEQKYALRIDNAREEVSLQLAFDIG